MHSGMLDSYTWPEVVRRWVLCGAMCGDYTTNADLATAAAQLSHGAMGAKPLAHLQLLSSLGEAAGHGGRLPEGAEVGQDRHGNRYVWEACESGALFVLPPQPQGNTSRPVQEPPMLHVFAGQAAVLQAAEALKADGTGHPEEMALAEALEGAALVIPDEWEPMNNCHNPIASCRHTVERLTVLHGIASLTEAVGMLPMRDDNEKKKLVNQCMQLAQRADREETHAGEGGEGVVADGLCGIAKELGQHLLALEAHTPPSPYPSPSSFRSVSFTMAPAPLVVHYTGYSG